MRLLIAADSLYDGNNYNGSIEYIEEKIQEIWQMVLKVVCDDLGSNNGS